MNLRKDHYKTSWVLALDSILLLDNTKKSFRAVCVMPAFERRQPHMPVAALRRGGWAPGLLKTTTAGGVSVSRRCRTAADHWCTPSFRNSTLLAHPHRSGNAARACLLASATCSLRPCPVRFTAPSKAGVRDSWVVVKAAGLAEWCS